MKLYPLIAAAALVAACEATTPASTGPSADASFVAGLEGLDVGDYDVSVKRDLARARVATARFHDFDTAGDAEYTFLFLGRCMEDPQAGGMGYHFVNTSLLDDAVDVEHPEAVMYEAGPTGELRLVGLEYVIPAAAWNSQDPPVLFGQEFTLNQYDLWALHVWLWKSNPAGIFASWNPTVSCASSPEAVMGAH